jgi:hypothetical protein
VRDADGEWVAAAGALDPGRLHAVRLPSGAHITIAFYDGALSHAIAFDRTLLDDGTRLAATVAARARTTDGPTLLVLATDGETFGHHHRFGEMALARALHDLAAEPGVNVGGLGAFVAAHGLDPAALPEVEIVSPSSWSCSHGVERWRANCGDVTGGEPHWNQRWRAPLRAMVDLLVARASAAYAEAAVAIVDDPWAVRDAYGTVVDDDLPTRETFVRAAARDAHLDRATVHRLLGLLEMQRHLLFAQSSCAWFFADCAGIETAITLHHAARVVELVRDLTGHDLDPEIATALAPMQSNDPDAGDGRALWRAATAAAVTPARAAAGWAATALAGAPTDRLGALRFDVADIERSDDRTTLDAVVTVVDEAVGGATTVSVAARLDGHRIIVDAGGRLGLADLPRDARMTVIDAWWCELRDRPRSPRVDEVRSLLAAIADAGEAPDAERLDAVLRRLAPGVAQRAVADPEGGLADLAFLVDTFPGSLPARVRWTAQNAVLRARDDVLPTWADRTDAEAAAGRAALARAAAGLGVAVPAD